MTDNRNNDQKPENIALSDSELEKAAGGADTGSKIRVKIACRNCTYSQTLQLTERSYRMMKVTLATQPCPKCQKPFSISVTVE